MKYVEVVADPASAGAVSEIAATLKAHDFRLGAVGEDGRRVMRLLVADDELQSVLDALQKTLEVQTSARIVVLPVELSLPKPSEAERREEDAASTARESLYEGVEKNARLDLNFVSLVLLSTAVGAMGLLTNNLAVVIGAMVIAPLLGPNLAFGLGTALGDTPLMRKSALSAATGLALAVAVSVVIGAAWPGDATSPELSLRSRVGLDSVALALASGTAAALSLTTGLSSILVGVMVAVALLPPAATLGIMLGQGDYDFAFGAGLLLGVNVVCVNLASNIVFFLKGIRPRTWWEKEKAKHAMVVYILVWLVTLIIILLVIYGRRAWTP